MAGQSSEDSGGWVWIVIIAGLAYWYFETGEKPLEIETTPYVAPPSPPTLVTKPVVIEPGPTPPTAAPVTHNYIFAEDGAYGYISAVSEEDQKKGRAIGDVLLYRYLGKSEGIYRLQSVNDAGQLGAYYECPSACKAIKAYHGGTMQRWAYNPKSLIGAAFEDAIAGRLRARPVTAPKAAPAPTPVDETPLSNETLSGESPS